LSNEQKVEVLRRRDLARANPELLDPSMGTIERVCPRLHCKRDMATCCAKPFLEFGLNARGFDVLRSLRKELGRPVLPLHMRYIPKTDSDRFSVRDRRKLATLLTESLLEDVREELLRLDAAGRKGDWEQENFATHFADFPYSEHRLD
jgi:hypothetical protein